MAGKTTKTSRSTQTTKLDQTEVVKALEAEVERLGGRVKSLEAENEELKFAGSEPSEDCVVLDGRVHKIVRVDVARNLDDAVKKRFVDDGATVVVIDREGA